ncbi:putative abc transporter protein [Botrytis cinerea BcDW1]|uniref:Putative abc transporter protein n=1 Tax=Botryotinia fuckeliana (strain BcDW1) TaxID=1290391 RepID=M7UBD3_BOTF1|nr:putative abc transporter protein [Botrytis cinerea BcDW1]
MESPSIAYDNGEATTLMSTDADSLDGIAEMVHETWAQVIEVFIVCSHMSRFVAKNLRPRQKAWNVATQNRIGATSSFISSMKIIKMIGLQHNLTRRVQQLRKEELWVASKLRWVMVYYNASANALGIFSPAITLALFAVISQANGFKLNPTTAFPTMAILSMITHPANMVMTIVPRVVAAFAGFERIQSFLLRPSLQNNRGVLPRLTQNEVASSHPTNLNLAVQIQQLRIGDKQVILDDINIEVHATSFIIISGPTGSGKSTLLRTIIGEVIPTRGSIYLSTRKIAYCSQRPWLPSGSIREVIYGANDIDGAINQDNEEWYNTVTEMCCLTHDFDTLPDGDQTQIGSRGLNLSGGQRQRVTLARALFSRSDILLLDDTFSGLDGDTEQTIFDNLFGSHGLTKRLKITVILVSNSTQYFQSADHVVVLGDHGIIDQGDWQSIKIKAGSIAKFSSGNNIKDNAAVVAAFAKLSAQVRAKDEAEIDLARQSGDSALYEIFKLLMQVILLFVAQKWLTVSLPACMLIVYVVQKVYLRTSRQLRFLELEARAGVFSSFLESVEGLETIRSFGWSSAVIEDNITSVDNAQRPEFLLLCLQRWLNIVLDLLAATVATSVIALAVVYRDRVSGAQVGIALNVMLVANTTLLKLVESWTTLEISLGAIARLRTLENMTPLEGGMAQTLEPVESWPSKGNVEFKNITASYLPGSTALKNLSLNITSGQKIIVCGRTGSGKSTLLLTLLRLLELQSGQIILDDVDIKKVGLDILRQRCFITVSQDPLLLSNETLRFNLDPDGSTSNEILIASLKRTELWFFLQGATETDDISGPASDNTPHNPHPILDKPLSSFPELSVGQSQLLALCRALVKAQTAQHAGRKPIVLLDEVTSSLDSVTESIIHGIIDDEFTQKGHTVICVAHRIEALAKHTEPGRVAVVLLSNGRLQEVITDLNSGTWERLGGLD